MERATVRVFLLRSPGSSLEPGPSLDVCAPTHDGLREATVKALTDRGLALRALSFGPTGLVVYAEGST